MSENIANVEVLNTGTELLLGSVLNTHLRFLAQALFPLGLRITRQVTVPDGPAIGTALAETFGRADAVLLTGGLGPTTDDLTRDLVAELLGLKLVYDDAIMQAIRERFARRNLQLSERIQRQAMRPEAARVLANAHGTAPGLYLAPQATAHGISPHLFLLPGPPRELQPMFTESVLPILRELAPRAGHEEMRVFRIEGLGESAVEKAVGEALLALPLELGYCARPGEVDLRIIGPKEVLDRAETIIREKLGAQILSDDQSSLEKVLVDLLRARGETVTFAESCTGGFLAHRLTNVPGASDVFREGFVTYANSAKERQLGIAGDLLKAHGAVSAEVAQAMAEGARRVSGADFALATTGIAGPGGGSEQKLVGLVFLALATKHGATQICRKNFPTDRENFKHLAAQTAFGLLRRHLVG